MITQMRNNMKHLTERFHLEKYTTDGKDICRLALFNTWYRSKLWRMTQLFLTAAVFISIHIVEKERVDNNLI